MSGDSVFAAFSCCMCLIVAVYFGYLARLVHLERVCRYRAQRDALVEVCEAVAVDLSRLSVLSHVDISKQTRDVIDTRLPELWGVLKEAGDE